MEVAGQWRREWAGTAEYGKVTEGGVTRRVARAMEVVHASAPGAKVRVMRAAYHSTAGRGAPAASFLMHSSHSVISSGFNLLSPPSLPSKPLEISSTPLESSPERNTDTENYKVTEPDDFEISQPSKWRSSTRGSIRMPSEESSSTDNGSIIDLEERHKNLLRKYSLDSESSEIPTYRRNSTKMSTILDEPATLSTLKYKSLLNSNNDWNNRRKSYSFEYTSPLSETFEPINDSQGMESSTDSGICKSTELFNDNDDKCSGQAEEKQGSFKDWLSNNRLGSYRTSSKKTKQRDHSVVIEEPVENNISLQSRGKLSITVPIDVADDYEYKKTSIADEEYRKAKKVEFCKTELHFVPDTGIVNIIASDEKPPPSNDFRRRRSAFVPINGSFDKSITLFGDINKSSEFSKSQFYSLDNETNDFDESTATTKSILKNKIPKPKPYLLGENMSFGNSEENGNRGKNALYDTPVPEGVSLINKQLHERRRFSDEIVSENLSSITDSIARRTRNTSPPSSDNFKTKKQIFEELPKDTNSSDSVRNKILKMQMSPIATRKTKTRTLRESDLTYFGIDTKLKDNEGLKKKDEYTPRSISSSVDDLLNSVKLVREISNSVVNSETESEDSPEYQNVPLKMNFAPVPTPRPRTKYDSMISNAQDRSLKTVKENDVELNIYNKGTRRSRAKTQEETVHTSRSISAPPKDQTYDFIYKSARSRKENPAKAFSIVKRSNILPRKHEEPTYANYSRTSNNRKHENNSYKKEHILHSKEIKSENMNQRTRTSEKQNIEDHGKDKKRDFDKDSLEKKPVRKNRTEKLATPEFTKEKKNSENVGIINRQRSKESKESRNSNLQINPELTVREIKIPRDREQNQSQKENGALKIPGKEIKTRHETSHSRKPSEPKPNENCRSSTRTKSNDRNNSNRGHNNNPEDYKSSQRSKYIINYDDKNGTVSSVCKVKLDPSTVKKKKTDKEKLRETPKQTSLKNKSTDKIALLQSAESHWDPYKMIYADRKWKRKMHVQRSCQLL